MEITGEDGSKVQIKPFSNTVFGRGSGCITTDRTVSRCHVLFWLKDSSNGTETEPRACFDVIGKNPIWVRSGKSGKLKAFRRNEKGEVTVGDWFYIGGGQSQQPVRFAVKRINEQEAEKEMMEAGESSEWSSGGELESVDVSSIDPVKEFGFLVIGHEFDQYPKEKIREMKNWDWFLEEPRKDSDGDDEVTDKRKKNGMRRRRGKATKNDDDEDEWTGESEEDKEVIAKVKKMQKPTYSTRSKDHDKQQIGRKGGRSLVQKKSIPAKAEESEDEDDPTLGGFLVDDGDEELGVESNVDQEEEEEEFDDVNDD